MWSGPAFLGGEAEESRTASGALLMGSARGNKLILATNYVLGHPSSFSIPGQGAVLPAHSTVTELGPRTVTKALCSQAPQDSDHSPAP